MTNTLSLDLRTSALIIALILVPIVILLCAVAVALACSEYWSCQISRPAWLSWCRRRQRRKKRLASDVESSAGNHGTEASEAPLEYEQPVAGREQL